MFKRRRKGRAKAKKTFMQRLFRGIVSIIILTAFILALSFFAKQISTLDSETALDISAPLLEKFGISRDKAGDVAGDFASRVLDTNIAPAKTAEGDPLEEKNDEVDEAFSSRETLFKVAVIGDSQNNNDKLKAALVAAETLEVHSVIFLGDYTDLGVVDALKEAKAVMDASGLIYYSLPGDRDLYETVGPDNFHDVFGIPETSVTIGTTTFVLIDNSANYTLIGGDKVGQYVAEIEDAAFVLMSQPLYHPLASYGKPVMGLVQGEIVDDVKAQADELLAEIQDSGVKAIIAGDQHSFSRSVDETRDSLEHYVIGPVTDERADLGKTSITLISIYEDGGYGVEEIPF